MDYQFPHITCLDDVLPAIEGRDEFIVARRDWGIVVNYMVSMADTFPAVNTVRIANGMEQMEGKDSGPIFETNEDYLAAIRRECRGLLFYPDGRIMARRLHKFFNVNERDETAAHKIDLGQPHVILEKLDGSMITPVVVGVNQDGIRWGTKMGITEVSMQAEVFVTSHPEYEKFAAKMLGWGQCPIFEWCSRKQRIVVDYPEDRLVLIAIRDNVTGAYMNYDEMVRYASKYGVEVVKAYAGTTANMEHLISETRAMEDAEGWIIRFDDGQMLKVKGDWYVRIHKTKDNLLWEKNVVELLINDKMDDVKPYMLDDDLKRVEAFETDFWIGINGMVNWYEQYFQSVLTAGADRKQFAQQMMNDIPKGSFLPQFVFGRFDGKDGRQLVLDQIRKNTGTQTKIDSVRDLWGGAKWTYNFDGDV